MFTPRLADMGVGRFAFGRRCHARDHHNLDVRKGIQQRAQDGIIPTTNKYRPIRTGVAHGLNVVDAALRRGSSQVFTCPSANAPGGVNRAKKR